MTKNNLSFKQHVCLIILILVGILIITNISTVVAFFSNILSILYPFILGACIAFILNIPMSFFERKLKNAKGKRLISLILAILIILLVVVLVANLIIPRLIEVLQIFIDNVPFYTEKINNLLNDLNLDVSQIDSGSIKSELLNQFPDILSTSVTALSNIISTISNFLIGFVFAIYILIDKEKLKRQTTKLLNANLSKNVVDKIIRVLNLANRVFKKFFTVQCLEATILGSLCIIGMLLLDLPYAFAIGVLIGVTALIPVLGAFIGIIVGAILIVSVSPIKAIYFIIFVLILQQIEGNIIYPRVVGQSVGLPGIWVLFAVSIGGSIGGIIGMLVGVPIATTIYILLKEDTNKKIINKGVIINSS